MFLAALLCLPAAPPASAGFLTLRGAGGGVVAGAFGLYDRRPREGAAPSWFVWHETRRPGFVADRWPGGVPPEPDAAWEAARDEAAAALDAAWERERAAVESDPDAADERLQDNLLLAMGRAGGERAAAVLLEDPLAVDSPFRSVRGVRRVALGLLGTDRARAELLADLASENADAAAGAAAGLALLPSLDAEAKQALLDAVRRGPGDGVRRLALQALSVQGAAENARLMPAVLREVPRVFLAEQALLAAPDFAGREDQDLLTGFLTAGGSPAAEEADRVGLLLVRGLGSPRGRGIGGGVGVGGNTAVPGSQNDRGPRPGAGPAPGAEEARAGRPLLPLAGRFRNNPLEQRLESAAAFGLARIRPSEDGFGEEAVEELFEALNDPSTPGSEPSRAAAVLALGHLIVEDDHLHRVLAYGDGDVDRPTRRLLLPPRVLRAQTAGPEDAPDPADVERDAVRSSALLSAALLVRRLSAGPDAVAVSPLRLSAHEDAELRRETRKLLLDNAADTRQPRGVRAAAAWGLGLAADRLDPDGGDALRPGGGLDLNVEALAAGDPLVLAGLLGSLEQLAGLPFPAARDASEAAAVEAAVRSRTDAFLRGLAAGLASGDAPLTPVGLAAGRRVLQSLAYRPADAPVDAPTLEALAAADPFLAVEAAAALRWRNDPRLGGFFAERLALPAPAGVAAARALGELFDARSPSGLYRLGRTTNPVVLFEADAAPWFGGFHRALPFRGAAWWPDAEASHALDQWPGREELELVSPYLAGPWDESLLR